MRITILALGSQGDVQPLLALAVGLQQTGRHKICFAAPDNFEPLARKHLIDFSPLGIDTRKLLGTESFSSGLESGRNFLRGLLQVIRNIQPMLAQLMEHTWLACQDAETILYSYIGIGAYHVGEKLGIPCYMATTVPGLAPTRLYPNPGGFFPALPLGGGYNLLTYFLSWQVLQALTGAYFNRWRRDTLHLPPIPFGKYPYNRLSGQPLPVLGGYSPRVVAKPADWGEHVHLTGYWFLKPTPDWQPPAPLVEFLQNGPPPVYVGFGSMASQNPRQTTRLVMEALEQAGQRGILSAGWGGMEKMDMPEHQFAIEAVPHAWLFPRLSAVVHHGGAGTTGAGLQAGVPSVLVPHIGDQPFWAQRVKALGVGPQPIPRRKLTAGRLAETIRIAVTDTTMQSRAASLGEQLRAEDGIGQAIRIIEGW